MLFRASNSPVLFRASNSPVLFRASNGPVLSKTGQVAKLWPSAVQDSNGTFRISDGPVVLFRTTNGAVLGLYFGRSRNQMALLIS